eukprot:8417701-Karenia_brevis.AAC.1
MPYHDSRGLPKAIIPMGNPPLEHPVNNEDCYFWRRGIGTHLHIDSLQRVTCMEHLEKMSATDRCARIVKRYYDLDICSTELAMADCDGRVTTEHITIMERRARIRQTIPDVWKWPKKQE